MSSILRRGASKLLTFLERTADPAALAGRVHVYAKDVSGTNQLFARTEDGTISQLTPGGVTIGAALPENWQQQDVPANQAATAMSAGVSQLFDSYRALSAGSLIAIGIRTSAVLTAGDMTAVVRINGVASALSVVLASPNSVNQATVNPGVVPYAAGDLIDVTLATAAGLLPADSLDVEVIVEINT